MAPPLDSLLVSESSQKILLPGVGEATLRKATSLIAELADRSTRENASSILQVEIERLSSSVESALAYAEQAAQSAGLESLKGAAENGVGLPLSSIAETAKSLIDVTTDAYTDILSWLLRRKCGIAPSLAEEHDLDWLAGPGGPAPRVPFDLTLRLLLDNLAEAGIAPAADGRLAFDLEPREGKIAAPLCVPLRVPGRVIVLGEERNSLDYASLHAHELGCALAYAFADPGLPPDLRRFVDPAVPHAWGYLLEGVFLERDWIASLKDLPDMEDWYPLGSALALARCRKDAALVLALSGLKDGTRLTEDQSAIIEAALQVKIPKRFRFRSFGSLIDPVHRLRGLMLGLALRTYFRDRFGEDWTCDAEAGALMLSLWEGAGSWTIDKTVKVLELPQTGPGALLTETERVLNTWL